MVVTKPGRCKDTEAGMKKGKTVISLFSLVGIPIISQRQISMIFFLNQLNYIEIKKKNPAIKHN